MAGGLRKKEGRIQPWKGIMHYAYTRRKEGYNPEKVYALCVHKKEEITLERYLRTQEGRKGITLERYMRTQEGRNNPGKVYAYTRRKEGYYPGKVYAYTRRKK